MKTVFIINPKAGKGKEIDSLIERIKSVTDSEIYITKTVGDAKNFTDNYCKTNGCARFIACGGDGTLNEVLNGAINHKNTQIGVIPIGTGNDFCRNFVGCDFFDISLQLTSDCISCDAISYKNEHSQGYCANMFNIGFDCNVADLTSNIKKKPLFSGPLAYFSSILISLIKKQGAKITIELDGEVVHKGKLLLTSIANGKFCGGGVKSNPLANVNNGLLNINIIKDISHIRFISLLPSYINGTFINIKNIEKIALSKNCEKVVIVPDDKTMRLCIDGEIISAQKTEFNVVHNAFNFVVPKK